MQLFTTRCARSARFPHQEETTYNKIFTQRQTGEIQAGTSTQILQQKEQAQKSQLLKRSRAVEYLRGLEACYRGHDVLWLHISGVSHLGVTGTIVDYHCWAAVRVRHTSLAVADDSGTTRIAIGFGVRHM